MYDEWYSLQSSQFSDSYSSQWEIFGLKYQAEGTTLGAVKNITTHDVSSWVIDQVNSALSSPSIRC
jgi:hypothetical protein